MCGIAGVIDLRRNSSITHELAKKMSDVITHRGPDSDGQWISEDRKCALAFRRLAIIDLSSNGSQPMHSPCGKFHIVFNGEIYNHQIIRNELKSLGYIYHSDTDTESILYGYMEWGEKILNKMNGMWDFVIWNSETNEMFASRDRIGVKPLYYYFKDSLFVFGSEIKSILEHPDVKKELNLEELPNYLNFGMSSRKESLFKNIQKLGSASYLKLSSDGKLSKHLFWTPFDSKEDFSNYSDKDIQEHLLSLLRTSIKDRMMSDVPFGVFLSGGIDSSLNVALMAELMSRPVDTFTVGFKDVTLMNELVYAKKISDLYKTNHHEILIDDKDAFPILETIAWHTDEPNADPVCIPLYFVSKLTRDSGTVVIQVGEGSDEQFVGYRWMMQGYKFYHSYWKIFTSLPSPIRKSIYYSLKPLFKSQNQLLALEYLRRATFGDEFNWSGVPVFSPTHLEGLLNSKFHNLLSIPSEYGNSLHQEALSIKANADYINRTFYAELKQRLAEMLLMRVDKIGMAHSLEARVPFLDYRIVEFSTALKTSQKIPQNYETKHILKKAVEGILPNDIIYRKKQGFAAPIDIWTRNSWYDFTEDLLLNSKFAKLDILNKSFIKNQLAIHKSSKKNLGAEIYSLIALHLWYEKYF